MRPQVKSTIVWSLLGLSLALNVALAIGHFWVAAQKTIAPSGTDDYCLLDSLDLDHKQQGRLAEMRRKMHEKRAAYWQTATAIKAELAEVISAAQPDRFGLDTQLERYADNQKAMQRAVADHLLGVNAMLHPEQRGEFRTLLRTEMFKGIRPSKSMPNGAP
jgi:hypothetical protein